MVNPRRFPDSELVERNPKLDVDALYRTGSLFMDFTLGVPLAFGRSPRRGIGHVVLSQNGVHFRAPSSKFAHAHEQPVK